MLRPEARSPIAPPEPILTRILAEAFWLPDSTPRRLSLRLLEAGGASPPYHIWRGGPVHRPAALGAPASMEAERLACDLTALPPPMRRIAATVAIAEDPATKRRFGEMKKAMVRLLDGVSGEELLRYELDEDFAGAEGALIGEFHRDEDGWRLRPLGISCPGDEPGLRRAYGRVAAEALPGRREDGSAGFRRPISFRLEWSGAQTPRLEFGALVEDQAGGRWVVQTGENAFLGAKRLAFVSLTGAQGRGLEIDDDVWPDLRRVLVYAILRDGVGCSGLEGALRLRAPALAERRIPVKIEDADRRILALALLENVGGALKLSPQLAAFSAQDSMDVAYGWGLTWRRSGA